MYMNCGTFDSPAVVVYPPIFLREGVGSEVFDGYVQNTVVYTVT